MAQKIILFSTLAAYSIVASQSFMYILALKHVQLNLEAPAYIEMRKLIDASMRRNFKYVVYAALLTNLILVVMTIKNPGTVLFVASAISMAAIVADTILTVKGNMPINNTINTWSPASYPANWKDYRNQWLQIFRYRQIANLTGFLSLLIGAVGSA